jgi:hypothetical protein
MTDLMAKDHGLAVSAAGEKRVPVVVAPAAQQLYRIAFSHGQGREDFSSLYKFLKPSSDDWSDPAERLRYTRFLPSFRLSFLLDGGRSVWG